MAQPSTCAQWMRCIRYGTRETLQIGELLLEDVRLRRGAGGGVDATELPRVDSRGQSLFLKRVINLSTPLSCTQLNDADGGSRRRGRSNPASIL